MNQSQDQPLLVIPDDSPAFYDAIDEEQVSDEETNSFPGLGDEFMGWTDSMQAWHQALLHAIIYIMLGVLFYSFILETKFTVIDSMYFSVCIFTTVGYGDISPDSSVLGMVFTMLYALYGIVILGIFLGMLGDIAIERQQELNKQLENYASTKYLNSLTNSHEESAEEPPSNINRPIIYDIIDIVQGELIFIAILAVLCIPICYLENWSFLKGLYWLVITATTVGLGDEFPAHEVSKLMCIFYVPLAVVLGGSIIGHVATAYVDKRNKALETEFLGRALRKSDLKKIDTNDDKEVTKDEFLCYMLKTLGKVEEKELKKICDLFDKLDVTNNGLLTPEDIEFIPSRTAMLHYKSQRNLSTSTLF